MLYRKRSRVRPVLHPVASWQRAQKGTRLNSTSGGRKVRGPSDASSVGLVQRQWGAHLESGGLLFEPEQVAVCGVVTGTEVLFMPTSTGQGRIYYINGPKLKLGTVQTPFTSFTSKTERLELAKHRTVPKYCNSSVPFMNSESLSHNLLR